MRPPTLKVKIDGKTRDPSFLKETIKPCVFICKGGHYLCYTSVNRCN